MGDDIGIPQFPCQAGSSLNAAGINYGFLQQQAALKWLEDLETLRLRWGSGDRG